jgi:hypothetical protein
MVETQQTSPADRPRRKKANGVFSVIPKWFLVILGVVYASGYFVVLTHLDTFGISASSAEFWRGKYIHIGILCVALPLIVNGTIYPFLFIYRSRFKRIKKDNPAEYQRLVPRLRRILPVMILYLNFEGIFYIFVMFTRPATREPHSPIGMGSLLAVLIATLCMFIITGFEELHRRIVQWVEKRLEVPWFWPESWDKVTVVLRWLLVLVVLCLDVRFLLQYDVLLLELLEYHWHGLLIYASLVWALGFFLWKMYRFINKPIGRSQTRLLRKERIAAWILVGCIMSPLCYLMLVPFSHSVFLYIPATRGGGDYTVSPQVSIDLKQRSAPDTAATKTKAMVLIEETSTGIYVADPDDAGGPKEWRKSRSKRPNVHFYGYDSISHLLYTQPKLE